MLALTFQKDLDSALRILCLGAHSDDIEIGCGGTILRLTETYPHTHVTWIVFGAHGQRASEATDGAELFLKHAKEKHVIIRDFRDGFFPYVGGEIKEYFEQLKQDLSPELIFTHCRHDLHQDHRLICELTWNTFRDHWILEYETPKYDGDLGTPNFFVNLDEAICRTKIEYILGSFTSQQNRHWFSDETFRSIMRLRGIESKAPGEYAEAFFARKTTF